MFYISGNSLWSETNFGINITVQVFFLLVLAWYMFIYHDIVVYLK